MGPSVVGWRLEAAQGGVGVPCRGGATLWAQFPVLAAAILLGVAGRAWGLLQDT